MIADTVSTGFDRFYPVRVLAAATALWSFRRYYAAKRWAWSWTTVVIGTVTFVHWMALEPMPTNSAEETELASGVARTGAGWGTIWLSFRMVGSVVTVLLAKEDQVHHRAQGG